MPAGRPISRSAASIPRPAVPRATPGARLDQSATPGNPPRLLAAGGAVGGLDRVLELRAADAILDRQVLDRLHEERDALDPRELRLEARDHVARAHPAVVEGLQVDLDAAAVRRRVDPVDADEGREAF